MSLFVEDMSISPAPSTVERHLESSGPALLDHKQPEHAPAPAPMFDAKTDIARDGAPTAISGTTDDKTPESDDDNDGSDEDEDEDEDGFSVMSGDTVVALVPQVTKIMAAPQPTTIALRPHNLTHEDLRASRMAATLQSVFAIGKTRPPSLASPGANAEQVPETVLSPDDLRTSRIGGTLDGLFGLGKGVHFTESPDEILSFADEEDGTDSDGSSTINGGSGGHGSEPKSAFSLSPTTPREKRLSRDPNVVAWSTADVENPQTWGTMYRWTLTAVVGFMTVNATFASSAPSAAVPLIAEEFGVSEEVATLTTSIYLVGYIFGPAFWGPGSEILGRRMILILTMFAFCLTTIGQALAPNIGVFLGTRLLSGFFAVAPLVNGGGVVADIWDPVTRGFATTVFSTMIFLGPALGPIVGGFVIPSSLGWRFIFWIIVLFAACSTLLAIFVLPETHAPTLMAQKARRLRTLLPARHRQLYAPSERVVWTARSLFERTLLRPFKMLVVEPILLFITIYIGIVYGCLYSLFEAVPIIFGQIRGFTVSQTGLIFLFVGLGAVFSTGVDLYFVRSYPALLARWRGSPPPENRLYGAMIAGVTFVISIFWLGWSGYNANVHWIVPALSLVLIGFSVSLVFNSFMTYLVDTYLMHTASAFAALTIVRSSVGAAFPLFIVQMFRALGINIACTIIGAVGILLAPLPFIFFRYGPRIRGHSQFAPCLDLKVAKEIEAERQAAALAGHV